MDLQLVHFVVAWNMFLRVNYIPIVCHMCLWDPRWLVDILISLQTGCLRIHSLTCGRDMSFIPTSECPDCLWGPASLLFSWCCDHGSEVAAVSSQPVILLQGWEWVELYFHLFICLCGMHGNKFAIICDYVCILLKWWRACSNSIKGACHNGVTRCLCDLQLYSHLSA